MICLGSWINTFKATGNRWRFELFSIDFAVGALLISLLAAYTLGTLGADLEFQRPHAGSRAYESSHGTRGGGCFCSGEHAVAGGRIANGYLGRVSPCVSARRSWSPRCFSFGAPRFSGSLPDWRFWYARLSSISWQSAPTRNPFGGQPAPGVAARKKRPHLDKGNHCRHDFGRRPGLLFRNHPSRFPR